MATQAISSLPGRWPPQQTSSLESAGCFTNLLAHCAANNLPRWRYPLRLLGERLLRRFWRSLASSCFWLR
jgi:hypothetical protein